MRLYDENNSSWADKHAHALAKVAPLVDRQLSPLGLVTIDALRPQSGQTILDIGCGAGQTVSQLAKHVGREGRVIGIDISQILLSIANDQYADNHSIEFLNADAQTL